MKNRKFFYVLLIFIPLVFTSCFSLKKSPLYSSEWLMENVDDSNQTYYHQLFIKPNNQVTLQVYYANSTKVLGWTGTYKLSAKKINFNFDQCTRFEDNVVVGKYTSGKLIKYYTGEYLYSTALVEEPKGEQHYRLELVRPNNYFLGKAVDIFGNSLEEFVKLN